MKRRLKEGVEKHDIFILIVLCLLCNSYKIIFSCFFSNPGQQTHQDLFGTLYASAYFAGKDWTLIGREYCSYYGYGLMALFSWLYRVTNDGLFIYRFILLCCNLLTIISCIFCYKIVLSFQVSQNKWLLYFLCIACTSVQGTSFSGIYNEYGLNVCVWAVLYLLFQLCDTKIHKAARRKHTFLLGICLIYGCTMHARFAVVYALVILCVLVIGIIRKRIMIDIPVMAGTCLLVLPYKYFTYNLQVKLLGEVDANSTLASKASYASFENFSFDMIRTFLISVITYFHELSVLTIGLSVICLASVVYIIYFLIRKQQIMDISPVQGDKLLIGLIYSIVGIGFFLVGMCFSTRVAIYRGITLQINIHLRMLTLVRYFMPFVAPAVLLTILLLMKVYDNRRKGILALASVILCAIQIYYMTDIFPSINFTGWAHAIYLPYTWDVKMNTQDVYLVGGVLLLFNICFLVFLLIRKGNWWGLCIVLFLFSTEGMAYRYVHQIREIRAFDFVDGGYAYFRKQDEGKDIYIVAASENDDVSTYYFLYQILLPNMHIIPGGPPENAENILILSNNPEIVPNYENLEVIQLDDNEWLLKEYKRE